MVTNVSGVEILATQEVVTAFGMDWNSLFLLIIIMGIVGALLFSFAPVELWNWWQMGLLGLSISLAISLLIGFPAFSSEKPIKYETQYKVTLSDEVKMSDFFDKFEIVDQEGKIYIVRERE